MDPKEETKDEDIKTNVNFLPKKQFKFVIWNTKHERDDVYTIEQTMMPRDTEEQIEKMARFKLTGILSEKDGYSGQKIRKEGEPK